MEPELRKLRDEVLLARNMKQITVKEELDLLRRLNTLEASMRTLKLLESEETSE